MRSPIAIMVGPLVAAAANAALIPKRPVSISTSSLSRAHRSIERSANGRSAEQSLSFTTWLARFQLPRAAKAYNCPLKGFGLAFHRSVVARYSRIMKSSWRFPERSPCTVFSFALVGASHAKPFLSGQTVRIVVGYLAATPMILGENLRQYWQVHLGNPNLIVQNMTGAAA